MRKLIQPSTHSRINSSRYFNALISNNLSLSKSTSCISIAPTSGQLFANVITPGSRQIIVSRGVNGDARSGVAKKQPPNFTGRYATNEHLGGARFSSYHPAPSAGLYASCKHCRLRRTNTHTQTHTLARAAVCTHVISRNYGYIQRPGE